MQLASVQAERNSLREDLVNYRTSKRHVDSSWRAERDKAERLEKELSFYQGQSARAMADRDKVTNMPLPSKANYWHKKKQATALRAEGAYSRGL